MERMRDIRKEKSDFRERDRFERDRIEKKRQIWEKEPDWRETN